MASFFTGSVRLVLWAAGGIFGTLIALYFSAYCVKGLAKMFVRTTKGRPALRWALASLYGPREATGSIVLALGLGLTVLASIGQIDGNLRGAITTSLPKVAPSYFFVDIQKSQMQEFEAILSKNDEVFAGYGVCCNLVECWSCYFCRTFCQCAGQFVFCA